MAAGDFLEMLLFIANWRRNSAALVELAAAADFGWRQSHIRASVECWRSSHLLEDLAFAGTPGSICVPIGPWRAGGK